MPEEIEKKFFLTSFFLRKPEAWIAAQGLLNFRYRAHSGTSWTESIVNRSHKKKEDKKWHC